MAKDISIKTRSIGTGDNKKTYYSFDIVDPSTGRPIKSFNTTDDVAARKFYELAKEDYPDATTNGETGLVDLNDKLPSQGEYELGGFETTDCKLKPWPLEAEACKDAEYEDIKAELNDFDPSVDGPLRQRKTPNDNERRTTKQTKLAVDVDYANPFKVVPWLQLTKKERCEQKSEGAFGHPKIQAMVNRTKLDNEIVFRGVDNNAFIVIGNDRVNLPHTGWGGKGHTQCDAIDIVVGVAGPSPKNVDLKKPTKDIIQKINSGEISKDTARDKLPWKTIPTNPNFYVDAARIYISQKTNVDRNFGLRKFKNTVDDEKDIGKFGAKSAIAMKADNIRIIGRESLHLVTMTDVKNSQGGEILGKAGVELVAMNLHEELQPMVLGDNLQLALLTIVDNIEALAKIMHGYIKYQMKYNQALQQHTHISPFYAKDNLVSDEAIIAGIQCDIETASKTEISIMKHITNLQGVKTAFLVESGDSFISSPYNKCN